MPLAFLDVRKTFINFVTNSNVWNGLISNAFSIGIIVSIIILLILVLSYNESKSITKNMISFVLYSSIFTTVMFVLHDSVLLYNYKIKNSNELERKVISNDFTSNNPNSQFFSDIVPINGAREHTSLQFNGARESTQHAPSQFNGAREHVQYVPSQIPVSQSHPIQTDQNLLTFNQKNN